MFQLLGVGLDLGGAAVLEGLDLSIAPGERVAVLGVNGSGKTSLLRLLDGLAFPTRGEVRYAGESLDAKRLDDASFRRRFRSEVALLFQNVDAMLFNPTGLDEVAFGPRQLGVADVDARVAKWARALEAEPLLARAPFELSGGEKKRLALAAILALEPKVLLLDEPTANLDPASAARLIELLHELKDVTVVATTHNLSIVEELGDRAVLLSQSHRVLYDGPPAALLANEMLLIDSGLAHRHKHKHDGGLHAHFHVHDLD